MEQRLQPRDHEGLDDGRAGGKEMEPSAEEDGEESSSAKGVEVAGRSGPTREGAGTSDGEASAEEDVQTSGDPAAFTRSPPALSRLEAWSSSCSWRKSAPGADRRSRREAGLGNAPFARNCCHRPRQHECVGGAFWRLRAGRRPGQRRNGSSRGSSCQSSREVQWSQRYMEWSMVSL